MIETEGSTSLSVSPMTMTLKAFFPLHLPAWLYSVDRYGSMAGICISTTTRLPALSCVLLCPNPHSTNETYHLQRAQPTQLYPVSLLDHLKTFQMKQHYKEHCIFPSSESVKSLFGPILPEEKKLTNNYAHLDIGC